MYVCNMGGSAGSICCPDPSESREFHISILQEHSMKAKNWLVCQVNNYFFGNILRVRREFIKRNQLSAPVTNIIWISGYFCLQARFGGDSACVGTPVIRYGYDPNSDTCVPFQYTGCRGNLNNFVTNQQCTNICCNKGYNRGGKQLKQQDFPVPSTSSTDKLRDSVLSTASSGGANVTHVLHSVPTTTTTQKSTSTSNSPKTRIARWLSWLWS